MTLDHISLSGQAGAFPLTADAKRLLLSYLDRARAASAADPDGDDSVRDIESSIGDRLHEALAGGAERVDARTMARILEETGPLEPEHPLGGSPLPWLCRVDEGRWFGGLCLGLATRAELPVDWVRTVAIFLLFLTGGLLGLAYLVALIFTPPMQTVAQYRSAIAGSARGSVA